MDDCTEIEVPTSVPDVNMEVSKNVPDLCEENLNSLPVTNSEEIKMIDGDSDTQNSTEMKENNKRPIENECSEDEPVTKKRSTELEKLWDSVTSDPSDFQNWTALLQHVDKKDDIDDGREVYDKFFERYPYCYGYWKKYADMEKRLGTDESTLKVFNRGLEAIGLSVDLWNHYMQYVMGKYEQNQDFIREQFESSLAGCGLDYKSDRLWEMYVTWEMNGQRLDRVMAIYDRLIAVPLSNYMMHWQNLQDLIKKHNPKDLLSAEEYITIRRTILTQLNRSDATVTDELPPGDEAVTPEPDLANEAEEMKLAREHLLSSRLKVYEATAAEVKSRWAFEDAIKRPYFHVKPLEKGQLSAWRNYIEFEQKKGDAVRIKTLYERCLIATALYEEFWMRYVRYLEENSASDDELRALHSRACRIHLRDKLRPHLSFAAFEEERGNSDAALSILRDWQDSNENCVETYMLSVAIERRRGNLDQAEEIYLDCLSKWKNENTRNLYTNVAIKYARFLSFFKNESEKAIEVLNEALDFDEKNMNLLLGVADHAMSCRPPKLDVAAESFKRGVEKASNSNVKMLFAHRYLQFVTECGSQKTSFNDALRLLRKVQRDAREALAESSHLNKTEDAAEISEQKSAKALQTPVMPAEKPIIPSPMNGNLPPQTNNQHSQPPNSQFQNYQAAPNYNNYNQYSQNYSSQYQNWGYQNQQGTNYPAYNQQSWGAYPNYYGQR